MGFSPVFEGKVLCQTRTPNPSPQGGGGQIGANLSTPQNPALQSIQVEPWKQSRMDWQLAIDKNREKLLSIIFGLMASLGLVDGGRLTTLPVYLYRKALMILRPAEAAVRRLIMMAAYEMELRGIKLLRSQANVERHATPFPSAANFAPSFNLIDPLKPFTEEAPDYGEFGGSYDVDAGSIDQTPISAVSLGRRLLALKNALDGIDKQARRITRWYAIRDAALKRSRAHRLSPLRPGLPPGYAKKSVHPIANILLDCHYFAQCARERRDSP
jgi:hypothetical protein